MGGGEKRRAGGKQRFRSSERHTQSRPPRPLQASFPLPLSSPAAAYGTSPPLGSWSWHAIRVDKARTLSAHPTPKLPRVPLGAYVAVGAPSKVGSGPAPSWVGLLWLFQDAPVSALVAFWELRRAAGYTPSVTRARVCFFLLFARALFPTPILRRPLLGWAAARGSRSAVGVCRSPIGGV